MLIKNHSAATLVVAGLFAAGITRYVVADEQRSTLADQSSVAITIYNEDLALVKDIRRITLDTGLRTLALRDVSGKLRPETAQLRSISHPAALHLLEQNFDFDLLTPQKLLEKSVGQMIRVIRTNPATGVETLESAEVLSVANGTVLKIGDRIETGVPGRPVFDHVPANLRDHPTLVVTLENDVASAQQLELSYLTGGLAWKADYVAELSPDDKTLDLNGWVTLTNTSGSAYPNATLQLVAGDVNRVREDMVLAKAASMGVVQEASKRTREMSEESLFEYHLYTLNRPTSLADNQTKQVALLSATQVPVSKELVLHGNDYYYSASYGELGQKLKFEVFVTLENTQPSHLGLPLPKGVVRVYKRDKSGNAQFIGEDQIDHTPKNETLKLKLGNAFDVTADKKQTDFKRTDSGTSRVYIYESAYEIKIKNAKAEAVTVNLQEPIPGDWRIMNETYKHEKAAAHTALWKIAVPANGNAILKYRVQCRY
ncbi:MAG: DUF4139 domain-containing protein [Gammaproteobacteria bacterium]|nr:DUF4139 domain-containing protein [Gammaproteobacteria bacterium]